jgi:hypothetical protein
MPSDRRAPILASVLAAASLSLEPAHAQLHQRKQGELEQWAQVTATAVGVTFQASLSYEKCFEAVNNFLKRAGHEIETANKDGGSIVTAMEISGKYTQTGTRLHVTLIKDNDTQTSVRVAVTAQKRKKLLATEPWSNPKVDDSQTSKIAAYLEEAFKNI